MEKNLNRRLFLSTLAVGTGLGLSACGSEEIKRVAPSQTPTPTDTASQVDAASHPRKWVHFGDSLTATSTTVTDLANLTGYEHINAGISGDKAINAALRSGARKFTISLENNIIAESGENRILQFEPTDFISRNSWKYPAEVAGVKGYLISHYGDEHSYFARDTPGEAIEIGENIEVLLDPSAEVDFLRKGPVNQYSMIIGLGRNDKDLTSSIESVIENIEILTKINDDPLARFLVWEIVPWAHETVGTESRQEIDDWNRQLGDRFGDRFVTPVTSMFDNPELAFSKAMKVMTEQDKMDLENRVIPESFRTDMLGHLNEAGSRVWAYFMFQEIKKRGW